MLSSWDAEKDDDPSPPPPPPSSENESLSSSTSSSNWIDSIVFQGIKWALENELSNNDEYEGYDATFVISKLQEMMSIVATKTGEVVNTDGIPWYCFLSLIHLSETVKKQYPEYRDRVYREGARGDVTTQELLELADAVEFSEWAYDESYSVLKKKLLTKSFVLLRHDVSIEPGRVGHFIAINHEQKVTLIGLKGTSSFTDLVTDCVGKAVERKLDAPFDDSKPNIRWPFDTAQKGDLSSNLTIRCHEGIWTAAQTMADDMEQLIRNLFLPCGYRIVICGHSLGAGTACLLGVLLRSRIPQLQKGTDKLRVLAVATPPVLNYRAALACAPFTTSLVNNSDIVPRMGLSTLVIVSKVLVIINERLEAQGKKPQDWGSAIAYVQDLMNTDLEPLMTLEEIDAFIAESSEGEFLNKADNLYVPGRAITIWGVQKTYVDQNKKDESSDSQSEVNHDNVEERGVAEQVEDEKGMPDKESVKHEVDDNFETINVVAADGSMRMLRQLELESTFLDDHRTNSYRESVKALLDRRF